MQEESCILSYLLKKQLQEKFLTVAFFTFNLLVQHHQFLSNQSRHPESDPACLV